MTTHEMDSLLIKLKALLKIPYLDETEDMAFRLQVESCIDDLDHLTGVNDYSQPGLAFNLLYNRLLYLRSDALDDFGKNYKTDILRLFERNSAKDA